MNPFQLAVKMIKNNPNIANNPQVMDYIKVLESGDSKKGEEIANNLCKTYGVTKEDGVNQAKSFFGNMFGGGASK